jgi:phenylacetate-CoA ligase
VAHVLECFYPYVPVAAQNFGISLYGLVYRRERLGGDFDAYVAGFNERDRWSRETMRSHVETELRKITLHAFEQVPYYAEKWKTAGIEKIDLLKMRLEDLPRLPLTPKQHVRSNPSSFVARNIAKSQRLLKYYSSGSTGTPVTAICTADGQRRFMAAREARSFGWAGSTIRGSRSMIGGRMIVRHANERPPYYRYNWAERQVYFSAYHISLQNIDSYVEGFNKYKPRLFTGYAYSHYSLARMMLERGLRLDFKPDALVLSSEKLTTGMKETIHKAFGARAYEQYGAVENCMLATECENGSLHVNPDFGIIEVIGENGEPLPPGKQGRIVCTGLLNLAQPLIRYQIGDLGVWSENTCACGRDHLPVLQEVTGRIEDVAVTSDGREFVRFHGLFIDLPHVIEAQVIQEKLDFFRVKVVPADGFSALDERLIQQRLWDRIGDVEVAIECVSELQKTERGKFKAVVVLPTVNHHDSQSV